MSTIQGSSSPTLYLDGPPYSDSSRSAGPVNEVALEILVVPPPIVAFVPQAIQNGSAIVDTSPRAVAARRTRVVALVIIAGIGVTAGLAGSGKLSEFGEVIAALVLVKIFALGCLYARDPVRDFD